jgi:hypothetical protein
MASAIEMALEKPLPITCRCGRGSDSLRSLAGVYGSDPANCGRRTAGGVNVHAALKAPTAARPARPLPPAPALDSLIISGFPDIFAEFRGKWFPLLWRGGRDGFGARDFHSRCDGHANTLTVILDTDGNIFGGFTPVEWEPSERLRFKADASLKSFLFMLKNLQNVPARRFALKAEKKDGTLYCCSR